MISASPFVTIEKPVEESIDWTIKRLENAGLQVIRTFNLQEARHSKINCQCPHHDTEECNCQMSVLLIYQAEKSPASLFIHSFQETTGLFLVDTPEQPVDQKLGSIIRETLTDSLLDPFEHRQ
jgi:hypothetical protein